MTVSTTLYRGHRDGHEYVVRARHAFLEAGATVEIDGVVHDPKHESSPHEADGLAFSVSEGISSVTYQVRRPVEGGSLEDAERIVVRTAGLGGAGEVDVTDALGLDARPLRPEPGSASAAREERRAAHPLRFAAIAAAGRAAAYLLPLLGVGALFSGLLRPARRWLEGVLRPVVEGIAGLLAPVRELRDAVLGFLFGWLPDLSFSLPRLSLGIPDWVFDVLVPAAVVAGAGAVAWSRVRRRARRLAESEAGTEQDDGPQDAESDGSSPSR